MSHHHEHSQLSLSYGLHHVIHRLHQVDGATDPSPVLDRGINTKVHGSQFWWSSFLGDLVFFWTTISNVYTKDHKCSEIFLTIWSALLSLPLLGRDVRLPMQ